MHLNVHTTSTRPNELHLQVCSANILQAYSLLVNCPAVEAEVHIHLPEAEPVLQPQGWIGTIFQHLTLDSRHCVIRIRWSTGWKALAANEVAVEVGEVPPDHHASVVTHTKAERRKRTLDPNGCSVRFGPTCCFDRLSRNLDRLAVVAGQEPGRSSRCNPDSERGTHSDPALMNKPGLSNPPAEAGVVAVAEHLVRTLDQADNPLVRALVAVVLEHLHSSREQAWQMNNETSSSVKGNVRLVEGEAVVAGHKLCSLADTMLQAGSSADSKVSVEADCRSVEEEYNSQDSSTLVSGTYSTYYSVTDSMSAKASKLGSPEAVSDSLLALVSEKVESKRTIRNPFDSPSRAVPGDTVGETN